MKLRPQALIAAGIVLILIIAALYWTSWAQQWRVRSRTSAQQAVVTTVHRYKGYMQAKDFSNAYICTSAAYRQKYAIGQFANCDLLPGIPFDPMGVYPSLGIEMEGNKAKVWVSSDRLLATHVVKEGAEWMLTDGLSVIFR